MTKGDYELKSSNNIRRLFTKQWDKVPQSSHGIWHFTDWLYSSTREEPDSSLAKLTKPPIDYFRMFYGDTANIGDKPVLECVYAFFGAGHMVFGTDMPFGRDVINEAIRAVTEMAISDSEKKQIFEDNARELLHLRS